ncbi:MAG: lysine exporter LysO family protein [Firmicutes bacterium]|nr:lysine exporter LysO family protein [Bacillota bacterium]
MTLYIPFICLAIGFAINWKGLPKNVLRIIDLIVTLSLVLLMGVIGLNIGTSEQVMNNLGRIGLNCLILCLGAIFFAVVLFVILEKTIMPLEEIRKKLLMEKGIRMDLPKERKGPDPLLFIMPLAIIGGVVLGRFVIPDISPKVMDILLYVSLVLLYTGTGVSMASARTAFEYLKKLGFRVLLMPLAIFLGGVISGLLFGKLLGIDLAWSVTSAASLGYYSLPGAFMTEAYGVEAGIYGFVVNVLRDVCTVALMPILKRISKGAPIASGAGGCMDSMFVPVSRAVGMELSLVALLVGVIITVFVPFWLPLSRMIFG